MLELTQLVTYRDWVQVCLREVQAPVQGHIQVRAEVRLSNPCPFSLGSVSVASRREKRDSAVEGAP